MWVDDEPVDDRCGCMHIYKYFQACFLVALRNCDKHTHSFQSVVLIHEIHVFHSNSNNDNDDDNNNDDDDDDDDDDDNNIDNKNNSTNIGSVRRKVGPYWQ